MDQKRLSFGVVECVQGGIKELGENDGPVGKKDSVVSEGNAFETASEREAHKGERLPESTRLCDRKGYVDSTTSIKSDLGHENRKRTGELKKESKAKAGATQLRQLLVEQNYCCAICRCALKPDSTELDHKTPVSDGGDDTKENLQWLCKRCNRAKGDMSMEAFAIMCERIVRDIRKNV